MWSRLFTMLVLVDLTMGFPSLWRRSPMMSPYTINCTTLADADHGKGNLTLSSLLDDSYTYALLQAGPSTDRRGHPLLNIANDPTFPAVEFQECNSTFMGYESNQTDNAGNTLFYGHLVLNRNGKQSCATRDMGSNVIWTVCDTHDGPPQMRQYWKLTTNTSSSDPAMVDFVGRPEDELLPFRSEPTLYTVNGTVAVRETHFPFGSAELPLYQIYLSFTN